MHELVLPFLASLYYQYLFCITSIIMSNTKNVCYLLFKVLWLNFYLFLPNRLYWLNGDHPALDLVVSPKLASPTSVVGILFSSLAPVMFNTTAISASAIACVIAFFIASDLVLSYFVFLLLT